MNEDPLFTESAVPGYDLDRLTVGNPRGRTARRDPRGDMDGYHRRGDHRLYRFETPTPNTLDRIKPFHIMVGSFKGFVGSLIKFPSGVVTGNSWLSHTGQVREDGRRISESNYPYHENTPVEEYLEMERRGDCRLTFLEINPAIWPDRDIMVRAQEECEIYHAGLDHRIVKEAKEFHGPLYNFFALAPMAVIGTIRRFFPFLKRGYWYTIPGLDWRVIMICSGLVNRGWRWGMEAIQRVFFPSSLSKLIPSPQDIFDSPITRYVCGVQKVYIQPNQRR